MPPRGTSLFSIVHDGLLRFPAKPTHPRATLFLDLSGR